MSQGMVRPAWLVAPIIALVALAAPVRAASVLPARMGMYTPQGAQLAVVDSAITVRVRGPIVEVTVTQTFQNNTDRATEATYIFPLPVDAAVSAMEIETDTRTIRAAIARRDQAQQRYEAAVAAGVGAALLDQERPDVFTQTVSAIEPKGRVVVTLRFDTVARYQGGLWELVLPLVVAPRYVPGTASGRPTTGTGHAPDTDRAPDASRITPGGAPGAGGTTDVAIEFADEVEGVTSPTHDLVSDKRGYAIHDAKSDHDLVIRWRAKLPVGGWVETGDDGGYAAVVVEAPPAAPRKGELRMLLVLDRAATTRGDADLVERPLVRALLGALDSKDRVAVTGSTKLAWQAPDQALRAVDESWGKRAGAFDLTKVLGEMRSNGAPLVLISDGLVADDRAALAAASRLGVPIHVIGIGPAPNRSLLAALAATTGGTLRFALIGDDIAALARDVLADAAAPPEPLAITWGTLVASDVVPATLPRLGANQAALVLAKVKKVQAANARVRGDVFGFVIVKPSRPPAGATTPRGALARRWAKLRLDDLVAAGNATAITEHALRHGLVSPTTSMVAVGSEVVVRGGVKHSIAIPVSVPEGMRWQLVKHELAVDMTAKKSGESADVKQPRRPPVSEPAPRDEGRAESKTEAPEPAPGAEDREYEATRDADEAPAQAAPPTVATGTSAADADYAENISLETMASPRSRMRLSLALGGGLAVRGGEAAPLAAVTARAEFGRRALVGLEGSLWLVDGVHGQGSVLGSFAYRLAPRLELGAGTGLRITGDALGPAFDLILRTQLLGRVTGYLRYDGALLLHDGTSDGQHAGSLGIEASF
jgi:Ca-activated chloride channel family protein